MFGCFWLCLVAFGYSNLRQGCNLGAKAVQFWCTSQREVERTGTISFRNGTVHRSMHRHDEPQGNETEILPERCVSVPNGSVSFQTIGQQQSTKLHQPPCLRQGLSRLPVSLSHLR